MKTRGQLKSIELPFRSKKTVVSFEVEAAPDELEKYQGKELDIEFKKHRNRRSLDANGCLWACLNEMAQALGMDNWGMYLYELERYGKYTHILVSPDAVGAVRRQWRETKIVGSVYVPDYETGEQKKMIQMLCFYGSSTYDTKEFSRLLDGVISDMKDLHLDTPDIKRIVAEMEKNDQTGRQTQARGVGKE